MCHIVFVVLSEARISLGMYHPGEYLTGSLLDAWISASYGFEKVEVSIPLRS